MITFSVIDTISDHEGSKVYLASMNRFSEPVIVKQQRHLNMDVIKRISELTNPHIPKIYEFEENDGVFTIVEEYIDGVTLDAYFKENTLGKKEQGEIFLQCCDAIRVLHEQEPPIIHRDIKPVNILVSGDGVVRLIDFNASREFKRESLKDTVNMGTKNYAPPEQYGFSQTDVRSDIYSLGVVINECSDEFPSVVKKCTMFAPEERYHSIDEMTADIEALLHPEEEKRTAGQQGRSKRESAKRKRMVSMAAVLVLLAITGIFVYAGRSRFVKEGQAEKGSTNSEVSTAEPGTFEKREYTVDTYNTQTGQAEAKVYYFLREGEKSSVYLLGLSNIQKETIEEIRIRKNQRLGEKAVQDHYWRQVDVGIEFTKEWIDSLEENMIYDVVVETETSLIGFRMCATHSIENIPEFYRSFALSPGFLEYLRDTPSDKIFTYNGYGRKITSIVNMDTGETLNAKAYQLDEEREVLTFSKEFCESLTDDKHITLRIYHTMNEKIDEEDFMEIDAVTREDAYVSPDLEQMDFVIHENEKEDLEIRLVWNDAKGNLIGIYPAEAGMSEIEEKYYKVTENAIVISGKYLCKLPKGEYQYMLEFGDVGIYFMIKVI